MCIRKTLSGADLCGYNLLKFDVPILWEEFFRARFEWSLDGVKIVDASEIFRKKEPRTLTAAVKKFCGHEHAGAHDAMADVEATWEAEIEARVRAVKEGRVEGIPYEEVLARVDRRLAR